MHRKDDFEHICRLIPVNRKKHGFTESFTLQNPYPNAISQVKSQLRTSCPAKGTVVFHTESLAGNPVITLSDPAGNVVRSVQTGGSPETVAGDLSQGIYLYAISGNSGIRGKVTVW